MLWYKAARESGARFFLSACALSVICACFVFFHRDASAGLSDEPITYAMYIWRVTYKNYLRELFMLIAIFLGVGGLARERANGTTWLTLGLPVSRSRIVTSRAAIGVLQVTVLAMIPAIVIPALSPLVGEVYPATQAWGFVSLWVPAGMLIFGMGLLASTLFSGEFTAPVMGLVGLLGYMVLTELPVLDRFLPDLNDMMSGIGMSYFNETSAQLTGSAPLTTLAPLLVGSVLLVAGGVVVTQRQDF
jgi:ABC-type transport system involved in multi-copper enzyme maturation permease subunit